MKVEIEPARDDTALLSPAKRPLDGFPPDDGVPPADLRFDFGVGCLAASSVPDDFWAARAWIAAFLAWIAA